MKRVAALLAAVAFVSCTVEPLEISETRDFPVQDIKLNSAEAVPGILNVKFIEVSSDTLAAASLLEPFVELKGIKQRYPDDPRYTKRHHEAGLDRWYTIFYDGPAPVTKAGNDLSSLPFIEETEEVGSIRAESVTFNDPMFESQWHYNNYKKYVTFIAGADVNLDEAWEYTRGSSDVIVAVIDCGVRYTHEDIAANMWTNEAELHGQAGVDDDGNGYVDDIHGYNFCYVNSNEPYGAIVPEDHGTHVSGTISAINGNGKGGCGIAGGDYPGGGVRIMSCQIIQAKDAKNNYPSDASAAFVYAADNGACISNNSWSGSVSKDALRYFNNYAGLDDSGNQVGPMAGGVSFFAAGNENVEYGYPAMYDEVFAVASIGPNMKKASYSCYGNWVDICAPGGDQSYSGLSYWGVYSCVGSSDSAYDWYQGTSMACPHVTGVAALALSAFGGEGFTRQTLMDILKNSANADVYNYNSGYTGKLGSGLVDAGEMMSLMHPGQVTDFSLAAKNNTLILKWNVPRPSAVSGINAFRISVNDSTILYSTGAIFQKDQMLAYVVRNLDFNTRYTVSLTSIAQDGYESKPSSTRSATTDKNTLPVITLVDGISVSMNRNQSASLTFAYSDAEGDALTPALEAPSRGLSLTELGGDRVRIDINGAEVFRSAGAGTFAATLKVSDAYGTASREFTYTVLDHISPEIKAEIPSMTLSGIGVSRILHISDYFDCDSSPAVSIKTSDPIVTYSSNGDDVQITSTAPGQTRAELTITDKYGDSKSQAFDILVRDAARPADVYPTTVTDSFTIRTASENFEEILVSLFSPSGQRLLYITYGVSINRPAIVNMPAGCAPGAYLVQITFSDGTRLNQTIIKI